MKRVGIFGGNKTDKQGSSLVNQVHETCRIFSGALAEIEATIKSSNEQELNQNSRLTT